MALHNLTTPVMAVAAVAAVVVAAVVINLGGLTPNVQNSENTGCVCVCGKKPLWKTFPLHLSSAPFLPCASLP